MAGDIFDLKRFAIHDGPGIRTTVFFRGCPLSCWWCHNPEGMVACGAGTPVADLSRESPSYIPESDRVTGGAVTTDALMRELVKDRVFFEVSSGGVTFSGGEPMMQVDFLVQMLKRCREESLSTAVDTSGYADREDLEGILELTDLFLFDLKLADDSEHVKYTGVSNAGIIENLGLLTRNGARVWIRVPLVPGITDGMDNISGIISIISGYGNIEKVSLLPYNKIGEDKFRRLNIPFRPGDLRTQTESELDGMRDRFIDAGFAVSVGG